MLTVNKTDVQSNLPYPDLIEGLRVAFDKNPELPARQHLTMEATRATLLLMPAWNEAYVGVKIASVFPRNSNKGIPVVDAVYILKSGSTGETLAILDGAELTKIRTAATSALASTFLSKADSTSLLMIGAGALAIPLIRAHATVRPIDKVLLWNRSKPNLDRVIAELKNEINIIPVEDLDDAVSKADIISCATLSDIPLVKKRHVQPGCHVDLVGAYLPTMRESDSELIATSSVFVDTYAGACHEGGDLVLAAKDSAFDMKSIRAELSQLCQGSHLGRTSAEEITVFKSVGASIEDLVAASIVYSRMTS